MSECERFAEDIGAYADGEPVPAAAASHMESCPACRGAAESLRTVEHLVRRAVAETPAPEWERFRRGVRPRERVPWLPLAAAALVAVAAAMVMRATSANPAAAGSVREAVAAYVASPGEAAAARVVAFGDAGLVAVIEALGDPRGAARAAELLRRFDPAKVGERLARAPEVLAGGDAVDLLEEGWTLAERPVVREVFVAMLRRGESREFALRELAAVDYVALLTCGDPEAQRYAMELARDVRPRLRVEQVIDLMAVPELRGPARDVLRRISGQDFGDDPAAWKDWWRTRQRQGRVRAARVERV